MYSRPSVSVLARQHYQRLMGMSVLFLIFGPKVLDKLKLGPEEGTRWKVRRFILWRLWIFAPNVMPIHPMVVEIFQSESKWTTDWPTSSGFNWSGLIFTNHQKHVFWENEMLFLRVKKSSDKTIKTNKTKSPSWTITATVILKKNSWIILLLFGFSPLRESFWDQAGGVVSCNRVPVLLRRQHDVISGRPEFTRACTAVWGPPGAAAATESSPSAGRGWWRSPPDGSCCRSSGQSSSYSLGSWSRTRSPSSAEETQKLKSEYKTNSVIWFLRNLTREFRFTSSLSLNLLHCYRAEWATNSRPHNIRCAFTRPTAQRAQTFPLYQAAAASSHIK